MYSCNTYTMEALANAGFAIKHSLDFIQGKDSIDNYGRLAVALTDRASPAVVVGRACMTLPVARDEL